MTEEKKCPEHNVKGYRNKQDDLKCPVCEKNLEQERLEDDE